MCIRDRLPTFTQGAEKAAELISKLTEFINANPELVRTIVKVTAGLLAFKAAALTAKLGFLELKGGVLTLSLIHIWSASSWRRQRIRPSRSGLI